MMSNIRRKIVWLAIVMVVTIVAVAGLKCYCRPTDSCVAVLGTREVPSVEQGFVCIGGEYVQPPYRLARRGREVLVNDVVVRAFGEWPLPILSDGGIPDKLPEVPAGITEKTSEFDKKVKLYVKQVFSYFNPTFHVREQNPSGCWGFALRSSLHSRFRRVGSFA